MPLHHLLHELGEILAQLDRLNARALKLQSQMVESLPEGRRVARLSSPTFLAVEAAACEASGLPASGLWSSSRTAAVVTARFWVLHTLHTRKVRHSAVTSFTGIGTSTIAHAVRAWTDRLAQDDPNTLAFDTLARAALLRLLP